VQDEGGVHLRCINPACPAQIVEKLRFFCARDQMDIEMMGEVLAAQLLAEGLAARPAEEGHGRGDRQHRTSSHRSGLRIGRTRGDTNRSL
jgi:hypothetical protein